MENLSTQNHSKQRQQLTNALLAAAAMMQQQQQQQHHQQNQQIQQANHTTSNSMYYSSMPLKKRRSTSPPCGDDAEPSAKRACIDLTSGPVSRIEQLATLASTATPISLASQIQPRNSCSSDSSQPDSNNNTLDTNQNDLNSDFDSEDEDLSIDGKKGKQGRNYRKMIIEKRRRDRINQSLNELRRLVPAAFEKQGSAKLEKAEILQLTVEHLKQLRTKVLEPEVNKPSMDYHTIGFQECAEEVARFLTGQERMMLEETVRSRVLSHLNACSGISKDNTWQLPSHLNPFLVKPNTNSNASSIMPASPASSSSGVSSISSFSPSESSLPEVVTERANQSSSPVQSIANQSIISQPQPVNPQVSSTQPSLRPLPPAHLSRVGRAKVMCKQVQQAAAAAASATLKTVPQTVVTPRPAHSASQPDVSSSNVCVSSTRQSSTSQMMRLQMPVLDTRQQQQQQIILAAQQRLVNNFATAQQQQLALQAAFKQSAAALNLSLPSNLY